MWARSRTVAAMLDAYRTGAASPAEVLDMTIARIAAHADPAVWIGGVDGDAVLRPR